MLIPFHQFLFFKKEQVEERMRCKIYNVEGDCMDIEKYMCGTLEETSQDYELCMISLAEKV